MSPTRPAVAVALSLTTLLAPPPAWGADFVIDGKKFTVPDGFTVELAARSELAPRPIVADFDDRGRLYVADSSGSNDDVQKQLREKPHRIVRLEDSDGDGRFDKQTVFADKMMFPEGAMWLAGSLYVAAPPSIWKLTDTNDDGIADTREEWFQGKTLTGCANDLHGPYAGPDGWVYWCKGAFAEQKYTLPNGKPFVTRASHIFRCRPDGTGVEPVMTGGMDNPVDVVFTPAGERIFTTTFLQHPAGGKRDGIIHAVYGGVYGKVHDVIDSHPRTGPDVMPVMTHLGPAAPCGLVRYESDAFGTDYCDNLFAALFNLHKITRHVLVPDGATFKTKDSDFLVCDSLDFHPTDLVEDADGSLLVVDTGGWYKLCCPTSQLHKPDVLGSIYRVRRTDAQKRDDPWGLKVEWDAPAERLTPLLDDPRPAVRRRAIRRLGALGDASAGAIRQVLENSPSPRERLGAVWAATHNDSSAARSAVHRALADSDETVCRAALHSAAVRRDRGAVPAVLTLLSGGTPPTQRAAAEAAGRLGDASAVPVLLGAAAQASDQVLEHSITYALIELGDVAQTAEGLTSSNLRVRRAAMVALDQMRGGNPRPDAVAAEMSSPDASLRETAAWIVGRHPEWGDALAGALAARLRSPPDSPESRRDLQHQLSRLARAPSIQKLLAERVVAADAASDERQLALRAMAGASVKEAPVAWVDALAAVLPVADVTLLPDAVSAARRLAPRKDGAAGALADALLAVAARDDLPGTVRLEALSAGPSGSKLPQPLFTFVSACVAPERPATERAAAADIIAKSKPSTDQLLALTAAVREAGPLEIGRLLAAFEGASDEAVGLKLVAALNEAKAGRALRGDMVRPRLAKFGPRVQKEAGPLLAKLDPDAAAQRKRLDEVLAALPAGDVRRGQAIFNSQSTACAACHAIGYLGGTVGPDLTRVGAVRQERDLLESVVYPSASFVQSYEPVLVDTEGGDRHSGIVRRNDADGVLLLTGPTQEVTIPRFEVKEMRPGTVSVMPTGLDQQLSPQELADLLAFLKACK